MRKPNRMTPALLGGLTAIAAAVAAMPAGAATPDEIDLGRKLAEESCSACHATGADDASKLAEAPAFRDLGKRYPVRDLEEALAEGIVTGHEDMPEVEWDADQITAFIGYLESIQAQ